MRFKHSIDRQRVLFLHPVAMRVLAEMGEYCFYKGLPFVVTCTVTTEEEDNLLRRKSSTHRTGRAFDLSIQGWKDSDIKAFCEIFRIKFSDIAATNKDGIPQLIPPINHGTAPHIHVQINARFAINEIIDL